MRRKVGILRRLALKGAIKRKEDFEEFGGCKMRKLPSDCQAIHKLLARCRPQVVLETGSCHGGSALMFASYADLLGIEEIISIDVQDLPRPRHPKIEFIVAGSTDPGVVSRVHEMVAGRTCSVILDSDHAAPHVLGELNAYHDLVGKGQALVVEDTLVDVLDFSRFRKEGGPLRALDEFLKSHTDFVKAEGIEPYVTTNYFGYLVRI